MYIIKINNIEIYKIKYKLWIFKWNLHGEIKNNISVGLIIGE